MPRKGTTQPFKVERGLPGRKPSRSAHYSSSEAVAAGRRLARDLMSAYDAGRIDSLVGAYLRIYYHSPNGSGMVELARWDLNATTDDFDQPNRNPIAETYRCGCCRAEFNSNDVITPHKMSCVITKDGYQ